MITIKTSVVMEVDTEELLQHAHIKNELSFFIWVAL